MNTEIKKHCDRLFGFLPSDRIEDFILAFKWRRCMEELEFKTEDIKIHNDCIGDGYYLKHRHTADISVLSMHRLHAILRETVKTFSESLPFLRSYNIYFEYRGRLTGFYTAGEKEWLLVCKGTPGDIDYVSGCLSQVRSGKIYNHLFN